MPESVTEPIAYARDVVGKDPMADQAFAVASNSTGVMALALNFNINYIAAANDGERIF